MNVRLAKIEDSEDISSLMKTLGYLASPSLIEEKLHEFINNDGVNSYFKWRFPRFQKYPD